MTISLGASDHFEKGPGTVALRKLMSQPKNKKGQLGPCQSRNGRKIMKSQENLHNTTFLLRRSCMAKSIMIAIPLHTLSKLFQLSTGHGALWSFFKKRFIAEKSHYCECGQLETVEHVLRDCVLRSVAAWEKFLRSLIYNSFLIPRRVLVQLVKLLNSLPPLFLLIICLIRAVCWSFAVCQSPVSSYQVLCISDFP
jgi:hypothetical protein